MTGARRRPRTGLGEARQRLPRSLRFVLAASLLLPLLLLAGASWHDHRRLMADAGATLARLADLAREHALKVIETNALVLDRMEDRVRGLDWDAIEAQGEAVHKDLRAIDQRIEQITSLHLVRPDGRLAAISIAWPTPPLDLSARPDHRHFAEGGEGLVFGAPVRGRLSGVVAFTMARSRAAPDGRFDGMVLGSLLPDYFQGHWRSMDPDGRFAIRLLRLDGLVLAQHPGGLGEPQAAPPATDSLPAALRQVAAGAAAARESSDGRLSDVRRLGAHPLAVSVTLPLEAVRAEWLRNTIVAALLCLSVAAMLCAGSMVLGRHWRSERRMLARLRRTTEELRGEIARREAAEAGLHQAQRLEALGRLTGGVAHDFNNLLTAILGTVHLLERHLGAAADDKARRLLAAARDAVDRGARLNASLLAFARRQRLDTASLDANELVEGFAPLIQRALGETVTLAVALDPDLPPCRADRTQLESALLNLAINARDAMPRGGAVALATRLAWLDGEHLAGNADARPGLFVAISLHDEGEGMPPEVRDRAFEPFFTTKPVGKGTGLGLSQVFGFLRQLGGHVAIDSAPGRGTVVTLYLPAEIGGQALPPPPSAASAVPEGVTAVAHASVLVAEDDERVREVTAETLRDAGFRVVAARDGKEALALLQRGERFDLLFSDIVMPGGMSGIELAQAARRLRPDLPVLLATGYAGTMADAGEHGFEVLAKPYDQAALARRLAELVGGHARGAA
jgi:two-component system, NtrC family, sensor kinase